MYLNSENIENLVEFNKEELTPTILKDNNLQRLTIFAIFENQHLDTHTSPLDVVVFVIKGIIKIKVNDTDYEVNEDQIFMIPANTPHSVTGLKDGYFFVLRL